MDPSIIYNDVIQGEVFLPGQILVIGGFALQANSLGHTTRENLIHNILAVALDKTGCCCYLVVASLNKPRYCYYFSSSAFC